MQPLLFCNILRLLLPSNAFAWGYTGHRIIAEIAEQFLEPETAHQIRDLLAIENVTTLAKVSTWADQIWMQRQTAPTLIRLSGEQIILRSTVKWLEKARTAYAAGANKIAMARDRGREAIHLGKVLRQQLLIRPFARARWSSRSPIRAGRPALPGFGKG